MRDLLRPANVLPAALAGWALALLVLAIAGLGANFGPHPEDASLAPPLPQVDLAQDAPALGALSQYSEVGQRPLLLANRRPAAVTAVGTEEQPFEFVLSGVLMAGEFRAAMLQTPDGQRSLRVREGDLVEGTAWRLTGLEPRAAIFDGPEGQRRLDLRVYEGSGDLARAAPPAAGGPVLPGAADKSKTEAGPAAAGSEPLSEEAQVEAIRRRIEARRAQMREQSSRARPEVE